MPHGKALIGDVAFETIRQRNQCKAKSIGDWDQDEIYPMAETLRQDFPSLCFDQASFCAGVFTFFK